MTAVATEALDGVGVVRLLALPGAEGLLIDYHTGGRVVRLERYRGCVRDGCVGDAGQRPSRSRPGLI